MFGCLRSPWGWPWEVVCRSFARCSRSEICMRLEASNMYIYIFFFFKDVIKRNGWVNWIFPLKEFQPNVQCYWLWCYLWGNGGQFGIRPFISWIIWVHYVSNGCRLLNFTSCLIHCACSISSALPIYIHIYITETKRYIRLARWLCSY